MKHKSFSHNGLRPIFAILLAPLFITACLFGSQAAAPTTRPAVTQPSSPQNAVARPSGAPEGGADLVDFTRGIAEQSSFEQVYTQSLQGTLKGAPYSQMQQLTRQVRTGNEALWVRGDSGFFNAWLDGIHYFQGGEDQACRVEVETAAKREENNPARRLPAVYGAGEVGRETVAGQETIHYTFNETAHANPKDEVRSAQGEAWVAAKTGLLLKYLLTVEVASQGRAPP